MVDSQLTVDFFVLLQAFGRVDKTGNIDYTRYCLAHLFTAYAFRNGVLGLAYIASSSKSTYGGICSKCKFTILYYNNEDHLNV